MLRSVNYDENEFSTEEEGGSSSEDETDGCTENESKT